ncbi:hypothetical protein KY311_00325 [Candidatus Woesearchaeota archaeon]|nr:hypothetical protein [Candidatus Woesearchaeota archaeon]
MAEELPKILDVLFYEPNGAKERIPIIRPAYESLKPFNKYLGCLVEGFAGGVMDPREEQRRHSLWSIINVGIDFPSQRQELDKNIGYLKKEIMKDLGIPEQDLPPMHFLTTHPYERSGETHIPGTYDEFCEVYKWFVDEFNSLDPLIDKDKKIGLFVFNAYKGNGELEKIMQNLENDFPMLLNCPWLACKNVEQPLSLTIIDRLRVTPEVRRCLTYSPEKAEAAVSTVAGTVLASPYPQVMIRSTSKRIGFDTEIIEAAERDPIYSYYVQKYKKELYGAAVNEGINNAVGRALAGAQIEKRCGSDDDVLKRLEKALKKELEKLKNSITEVL